MLLSDEFETTLVSFVHIISWWIMNLFLIICTYFDTLYTFSTIYGCLSSTVKISYSLRLLLSSNCSAHIYVYTLYQESFMKENSRLSQCLWEKVCEFIDLVIQLAMYYFLLKNTRKCSQMHQNSWNLWTFSFTNDFQYTIYMCVCMCVYAEVEMKL